MMSMELDWREVRKAQGATIVRLLLDVAIANGKVNLFESEPIIEFDNGCRFALRLKQNEDCIGLFRPEPIGVPQSLADWTYLHNEFSVVERIEISDSFFIQQLRAEPISEISLLSLDGVRVHRANIFATSVGVAVFIGERGLVCQWAAINELPSAHAMHELR